MPSERKTLVYVRALSNDFTGNLGLSRSESKLLTLITMLSALDEPGMACAYFFPAGKAQFVKNERIPPATFYRALNGLVSKGFVVELPHSLVINRGTKSERERLKARGHCLDNDDRVFAGSGAGRGSIRWRGNEGVGILGEVQETLAEYNAACIHARQIGEVVVPPTFPEWTMEQVKARQFAAITNEHREYLTTHLDVQPPSRRNDIADASGWSEKGYLLGRRLQTAEAENKFWKDAYDRLAERTRGEDEA